MSNQERSGTMTRIADDTHARIHEHNRDGETLSGTIGRALDALEREDRLPDAVEEVLQDDG